MFTERPWPSSPRLRNFGIVATFAALTFAFAWLGIYFDSSLLAGIPFFVAVPVGWYFFSPRRCPACDGRLTPRMEPIEGGRKVRILAVCPRCEINWDTGIKGDKSYVD
jgi:hypothetical protein